MSGSKENEDKKTELINEAIKKLDTSDFIYHKLPVSECMSKLGADLDKGLTK